MTSGERGLMCLSTTLHTRESELSEGVSLVREGG